MTSARTARLARQLSLTLLAFAAAVPAAPAETLVGAYLGRSSTADSTLQVDEAAVGTRVKFAEVAWADESFRSPPYYGLRAFHYGGTWRGFGIGADFTHYKILARTDGAVLVQGTWQGTTVDESAPLDSRVQRFDVSHGVNTAALLALYRRALGAGSKWSAYAGLGPALYVLHPENTVGGRSNRQRYENGGVGGTALAGVEFAAGRRWRLFVEAKYDRRRIEVETAVGAARTRLQTTHLAAGAAYAFGAR